jgi:hypothetical protein
MTTEELQALATLVADELERRAAAKAAAAAANFHTMKSQPSGPGTTEFALGRLRMSKEAMQQMLDAVPDSLIREVAQDRAATGPSGMGPPEPAADTRPDPNPNQVNRTGWRDAVPLSKWRS